MDEVTLNCKPDINEACNCSWGLMNHSIMKLHLWFRKVKHKLADRQSTNLTGSNRLKSTVASRFVSSIRIQFDNFVINKTCYTPRDISQLNSNIFSLIKPLAVFINLASSLSPHIVISRLVTNYLTLCKFYAARG